MKNPNPPRTYIQFPLSALAYGAIEVQRLNAILNYSVVEKGIVLWRKMTREQRDEFLFKWRARRLPKGTNLTLERHCGLLAGAEVIGITYRDNTYVFEHHKLLVDFIATQETRYGRSPLVRIRRDLFFDARDRDGLNYRELSVLAAVYSVIGRKHGPTRISQRTIRHRALGYKSTIVFDKELPNRPDGAKPLTDWQLRTLLDRLHERKLFSRFTYGRRLTYYSNRMTDVELREKVIEAKTYRLFFRTTRQLADKAATETIRQRRALATGKPPVSGPATTG